MKFREFLRRHTLWVAFAGVLTPLIVMVGLQYVWLTRLAQVSAIAHKAALNNYLEAVGNDIQYHYRTVGERALNISATLFIQGRLDEVAYLWKKKEKELEGVKRLFLVDFTRSDYGNYYRYNPGRHRLETPPASDESLAIIVASSPWQIASYTGRPTESISLIVDERNPDYRLILNPITDERSMVVGVAGMILDEDFMREVLLPGAIEKALPAFLPKNGAILSDDQRNAMGLTVTDSGGRTILDSWEGEVEGDTVTAGLPFVFTDWKLALHSPPSTPEQFARANFMFNMTVSVLLAAVLLGGIVYALKAADRAMTLSQMKSEFVSNVSHELRTPLASVRVFAELLSLGRVQSIEKAREYGDYIESESRRLSRLIENILDLSRIESGRKTYTIVQSSIEDVVESTLKSFELHLKHSGFKVTYEGPERPLPRVQVDPDALGQALHNLIDNAVKYSGDSRNITVKIKAEKNAIVISVGDEGIGIARAEQEKIFDRFHRVSTGLVHEVKGSGLGLSLVRHIMQIHGGRVEVESGLGKGSTFSIYLPIGEPSVEGETRAPEPLRASSSDTAATPSAGVGSGSKV